MGSNYIEDDHFENFLREILDAGHLEGSAEGITRLVIDKGEDFLSEKQAYVFNTQVKSEFVTEECKRCGADIPWSEMYAAYHNGGYCGWCDHQMGKGN